MKKVMFYITGVIWMACGVMAFGFAAAPEMLDAPVIESYIKAAAWGLMSFVMLGALVRMEEDI